MSRWPTFPFDNQAYRYDAAALERLWPRLHAGDAEPWATASADPRVLQAWVLFHAGEFERAFDAGLAAGGAGITVANKAQAMCAGYLERSEKARLEMLLEVAARAQAQQAREPGNPNAYYWQAYATGRYSQAINVAKALAQGLGGKVKAALEKTITLAPRHADAHAALGTFHAEVIDKAGKLIGRTQGADAAAGLQMFRRALELNPDSAIARVEYANGLVMLEGEQRMPEADRLYAEAVAHEPLDASERLHVEMAKAELEA
jgi:tetratricopeptide (TPR) repeat protein